MTRNQLPEGVGKKIVEALKMQTDSSYDSFSVFEEEPPTLIAQEEETETTSLKEIEDDYSINILETPQIEETTTKTIVEDTVSSQILQSPLNDIDDFELPANVAVLKQLITKLPSGVTKQTGAMIIRQTMEALGISMRSVLQEAQQVQESLNNSSRECQASIVEYKKQINLMEKQAQKYQRQYAILNDIISLFVQTNI